MKSRLAFLALTWLAAFTIVMILFLIFGRPLQRAPLPVRALAVSGVLTISMTQVVVPLVGRLLKRPRPPG